MRVTIPAQTGFATTPHPLVSSLLGFVRCITSLLPHLEALKGSFPGSLT